MGTTQTKKLFNRFKDGRTSVESDARSGRPSTSRNQILMDQVTLVMQDRRTITKEYDQEILRHAVRCKRPDLNVAGIW